MRSGRYFPISIKIRHRDLDGFGRNLPISSDLRVWTYWFLAETHDFWQGKNSSSGGSGSLVSQTTNLQLKPIVSGPCAGDLHPNETKL